MHSEIGFFGLGRGQLRDRIDLVQRQLPGEFLPKLGSSRKDSETDQTPMPTVV